MNVNRLKTKSANSIRIVIVACFAFVLAFVAASQVYALPVIPGAAGYGMDTPAGRGGTVYKVTSLAHTNTQGTLLHAINQTGPRVIVFEVSGTIEVNGYLDIRNPYITIAGQTAPSPGIFLRGAVIRVLTHDVLVQHIRSAPGDGDYSVVPRNRDAVSINGLNGKVENVVFDHVTFTWSVDEMIEAWNPYGDVTFRHVIAAEPLHDSIHIDEGATTPAPHGFGPIFDNQPDSKLAIIGSLFSHAEARQSYVMASDYVQMNNVFYDRGHGFNLFGGQRDVVTRNSLIGNVFKNGPSLAAWALNKKPVELQSGLASGSKFYLADNTLLNHNFSISTQWDLVLNNTSMTQSQLQASTPPATVPGLTAKPASQVFNWVLDNAGARPADRLPYETRIVNNARNGTGGIIDSVAEAGGWPSVAQNYRALTIPANPHGDSDGDGYTNLEEWLDDYAAIVEGRAGITGLSVNSSASGASTWSIQSNLQAGLATYSDRNYTFASVPASVAGGQWIKVANDSKSFTGSTLATFQVTKNSDVYLAYDDRVSPKPSWLSGWTDTGQNLTVNAPGQVEPLLTYSLYKRSYTAGSTVTLGPNGNTTNCLYIPIVK